MAKYYIDREALIEWLKRIPLKDLSAGLGLCRIIFEDDFKKAIKKMPKGIIADDVKVVRCKDCKHWHKDTVFCDYMSYREASERVNWYADDFCSYGERKDGDGNGKIHRSRGSCRVAETHPAYRFIRWARALSSNHGR